MRNIPLSTISDSNTMVWVCGIGTCFRYLAPQCPMDYIVFSPSIFKNCLFKCWRGNISTKCQGWLLIWWQVRNCFYRPVSQSNFYKLSNSIDYQCPLSLSLLIAILIMTLIFLVLACVHINIEYCLLLLGQDPLISS